MENGNPTTDNVNPTIDNKNRTIDNVNPGMDDPILPVDEPSAPAATPREPAGTMDPHDTPAGAQDPARLIEYIISEAEKPEPAPPWQFPPEEIISLIDHIKSAIDVDPWAKARAQLLLSRFIRRPVYHTRATYDIFCMKICPQCEGILVPTDAKYCYRCGQAVTGE